MEIKFRSWNQQSDFFIQSPAYMAYQGTPDLETLKSFMHHYREDNPLMLFTGQKDSQGKEVYHKDYLANGKRVFFVQWQEEESRFILMPCIGNTDSWKYMDECSRMKIVGNIYENNIEKLVEKLTKSHASKS